MKKKVIIILISLIPFVSASYSHEREDEFFRVGTDAVGFINFEFTVKVVKTEQKVDPTVLGKLDKANNNTSGTGMLHEVLESYEGGLISLKNGTSSPPAETKGSVYDAAHKRAPYQGGEIQDKYWNAKGDEVKSPVGAVKAEFTSNGVVIMKYP